MKLFAAVMPLFVVGISMVHFHPEMGEYFHSGHEIRQVFLGKYPDYCTKLIIVTFHRIPGLEVLFHICLSC